jgi:DNA polymerase III subunit delta
VAELKPAYLIHGDDHAAIVERRARLRSLAERAGDACSVELLEGEAATPAGVASALNALTFALGRRVVIVEGAERFKDADVKEHIVPSLEAMQQDTTVAFFACEDARNKAPASLHDAVSRARGQIATETAVKPWQLGGWVREQATRLGLSLDVHAAKALVAQVGERQQRLLRELEKLALESDRTAGSALGADRTAGGVAIGAQQAAEPVIVSVEQIERRAAHSTEWRTFSLADALVSGDAGRSLRLYLRLRAQGERLTGLLYLMASRLREAEAVSVRLEAGEPHAEVKRSLRMPSRAADRLIADVARSDPERLRAALCRLADLELDTRGGPPLSFTRTALSSLGEDTLAVRAILAICG